jgi:hypothetical protein
MLERLYAALTSGPSLNCRPQNSRQRIDLTSLGALSGPEPYQVLSALIDAKPVKLLAPLAGKRLEPEPQLAAAADPTKKRELTEAEKAERKAAEEQYSVLRKLATIADDAQSFEQETGAQVLFLGFPLLSLPPKSFERARSGATRRILAPIAFVPVTLVVKKGRAPAVEIQACGEGLDRVMPNTALLAWVEQQTGAKLRDLFADEEGAQPWREINELVVAVARALELAPPTSLESGAAIAPTLRSDDEEAKQPTILLNAVLGLFPLSNQSLVRDMEALAEGAPAEGPIESFLKVDTSLAQPAAPSDERMVAALAGKRVVEEERLVCNADPCQARAVRLARHSRGLVVHGPPGTGKSQTIANTIGDHLARGERVLLVCDKRTALDVVKHRLDALGLGDLCAVVHDAQRDQKDLYLGIRNQLDALADSKTNEAAVAGLGQLDAELSRLHEEFSRHDRALSARPKGVEPSFHELAGEWFGLEVRPELEAAASGLEAGRLEEVAPRERDAREVLERSASNGWAENPWRAVIGVDLGGWLARPLEQHRQAVARAVASAGDADRAAADEVLPFGESHDLLAQGKARASLAEELSKILERSDGGQELARWAAAPAGTVAETRIELEVLRPQVEVLRSGPLDAELALVTRSAPLPITDVLAGLGKLDTWMHVARKWYRFLFLFRRLAAASLLSRFGLTFSLMAVERVVRFLNGLKARILLSDFERRLLPGSSGSGALPDELLRQSSETQTAVLALLSRLDVDPALASVASVIRRGLADPSQHARLLVGLKASLPRAAAANSLMGTVREAAIFAEAWQRELSAALRRGDRVQARLEELVPRISSIESVLRCEALLGAMPTALATSLRQLLDSRAGIEEGWAALRRAAIAGELSYRLKTEPALQAIDGERMRASHARCRSLDQQKRGLVRDGLLHLWTSRQRERLLAATGTRLNGAGADLRRRLLVRGERVLKVRQVIAAGAKMEGGDPLFDLRPVWMASPGTVAQIFPREPLFDVVIFDESSQCRLEEALPVLTRGRRVVIAGDPQQLPPTRFFESAVTQSEVVETEGEQALFESQQAEVEDLLSAALNLEIEQCYLDVHYRSQNSDLIEFSNESFYESRLQAIPGHPANRAETAPLKLLHAGGTYEKRQNPKEAEEVVKLVRELLARPEAPSIGIACFNLTQRETIVDALDDAAAKDPAFAAQLAQARARKGTASFEGLFVKNLENVQGDERDHIIISTTYGPDAKGRFYRRFGPLGMTGGGRRLNVLVTRARQEVHLVTSIPREVYSALPPMEPGQTPSGAWLLFSYLQYAEELGKRYAEEGERRAKAAVDRQRMVKEWPAEVPSAFARALAGRLAKANGISSDVHWGNDGFCVDVALHHPYRAEDVTLGLLCDGTRYSKAADRVEWDLFRTAVLEAQGWRLLRLWTPQVFRDSRGATEAVLKEVADLLAKEAPPAQQRTAKPADAGQRVLH